MDPEFNLRYLLDAGSVLGACKFHGFIPWDDDMSLLMIKPTKWHVRPAKTQISLGTYPFFAVRSMGS